MAVGGQLLSAGELMLPLDLPCTVTVPLYITKQNQALQLFREYFYAPDAQLFLFLFLDVGGDSLAGVFSTTLIQQRFKIFPSGHVMYYT
jgi:hypothetical protein